MHATNTALKCNVKFRGNLRSVFPVLSVLLNRRVFGRLRGVGAFSGVGVWAFTYVTISCPCSEWQSAEWGLL